MSVDIPTSNYLHMPKWKIFPDMLEISRPEFARKHVMWTRPSAHLVGIAALFVQSSCPMNFRSDWEAAKRCLKQAVTAVPHTKIFAVGGDTLRAENAIGHVEMARRGVAAALSELVAEKYLSENEAAALVKRLLRENQLDVFGRKATGGNGLSDWKG